MNIPYNRPVKSYIFGSTFEIRDPSNRALIRQEVRTRDLNKLREWREIYSFIEKLMNGEISVPANGAKGTFADEVMSKVEAANTDVVPQSVAVGIVDKVLDGVRKRGRPRKS